MGSAAMTPRPYSTIIKSTISREYLTRSPRTWISHLEHRLNFSVTISLVLIIRKMRSLATSSMSRKSMNNSMMMKKCNNITYNSLKCSAPHKQMRIRSRLKWVDEALLCRQRKSNHLKISPTSSRSFSTNNISFARNTSTRKTNRQTDNSLFKSWNNYKEAVVNRLFHLRSSKIKQATLTDKSR